MLNCWMMLIGVAMATVAGNGFAAESKAPLQGEVETITGKTVDLSQYQGQVVMVVNVASYCGNTPQYKGLQALYDKYKDQGFVVLGFPANEFGKQEPGSDAEILEFCTDKYQVSFPMFSKVVVKGEGQIPLYQSLTSKESKFPGPVTWNFEKFLIGRDGQVVNRFSPRTKPESPEMVQAIESELAKK